MSKTLFVFVLLALCACVALGDQNSILANTRRGSERGQGLLRRSEERMEHLVQHGHDSDMQRNLANRGRTVTRNAARREEALVRRVNAPKPKSFKQIEAEYLYTQKLQKKQRDFMRKLSRRQRQLSRRIERRREARKQAKGLRDLQRRVYSRLSRQIDRANRKD